MTIQIEKLIHTLLIQCLFSKVSFLKKIYTNISKHFLLYFPLNFQTILTFRYNYLYFINKRLRIRKIE